MSHIIDIGAGVPRWHNRFLHWLGRSILELNGWRVNVRIPDLSKAVVILAPHTSNWDFVFGMAAALTVQIRINYFGKHTLFEGPLGWLFRGLGGYPVRRDAPGGVVQQAIETFHDQESLILALAPEGTRSRRWPWKRGFYHMAVGAGVPIAVAYIDYRRKEVGIHTVFQPSGDWDRDMAPVFAFYRGTTPKIPQNFAIDADSAN